MTRRDGIRTICVLAFCQALLVAAGSILLSFNSLVGSDLAPDPRLATLPHAPLNIVNAAIVTPASLLMLRVGRRSALLLGAMAGAVSAALTAASIGLGSFSLLCMGMALYGGFQGLGQYYRFAAAEAAPEGKRNLAVSAVIGASIVGVIVGPLVGIQVKELIPGAPFAGSYLAAAVFALVSIAALSCLPPLRLEQNPAPRDDRGLAVLVRPSVFAALANSVVAYMVMVTVMVATPLAVVHAGHSVGDTATVIQWHLVGMYLPSLVTGRLIDRFGEVPIMLCGTLLLAVSGTLALTGTSLAHFWGALLLLGIGWNLLFLGSTAILAGIADARDRVRAQGANEFLVCITTATGAFLAGEIFAEGGWTSVSLFVYPLLLVAALSTWRYARLKRAAQRMLPSSGTSA